MISLMRSLTASWVGTITAILAGFLLPGITVRIIGLELYGVWSFIVTVVGFFALIEFGTRQAVLHYTAADIKTPKSDEHSSTPSSLLWSARELLKKRILFGSLFVVVSLPIISNFTRLSSGDEQFYLVVLLLFIDALLDILAVPYSAGLAGAERYDLLQLLNTGRIALNTGLAILFLYTGFALYGLAVAMVISRLLYRFALVFFWRRSFGAERHTSESNVKNEVSKLAHFGRNAAILLISQRLSAQSSVALAGIIVSPTSAAILSIPLLIGDQIRILTDSTAGVLFSRLSQLKNEETSSSESSSFSELLGRWMKYSLLLPISVGLHLIVFGDSFLFLWCGVSSADLYYALIAIACSIFISVPMLGVNYALLTLGEGKSLAKLGGLELLLVLVGSAVVLSSGFPVWSVSLVYLSAVFAVQGLGGFFLIRRNFPTVLETFFRHSFIRIVVICLVYSLCLVSLKFSFHTDNWLGFFAANGVGVTFLAVLTWMFFVEQGDRAYIKRRCFKVGNSAC